MLSLQNKHLHGFTLIEVLITISIITVLFSLGWANFREFSQRQNLASAVRFVEAKISSAKNMALNGKKPTECVLLSGYKVSFADNTCNIYAVCGEDEDEIINVDTVSISDNFPGITVSTNVDDFTFKSIGEGVDWEGEDKPNITITLQNPMGKETVITIERNGMISY